MGLCGTHSDRYIEPNENSHSKAPAYIKGYAIADYEKDPVEIKVKACLRFQNTMDLIYSCGRRSCRVDCGFGACLQQYCGFDVCRTLVVEEDNPYKCTLEKKSSLFTQDYKDLDCVEIIDDYIRLRAVVYEESRKIAECLSSPTG